MPTILSDVTSELDNSYLNYALHTLTDRAIPDVRDGLKPSQRRILVSLKDLKLTSKSKHRKSALICGFVSGQLHPHGEAVIYPTMVRMAQPFSLRYPLIDGQGNFGNIGGSDPAAMRYTESRMSVAAEDILDEITVDGKWTVPAIKNYDETRDEPTVLPGRFPNLLANGASGIACGWATNIPPHNIREVVSALTAMVRDKNITDNELLNIIKGPDFPTGGIIHGANGIKELYTTGAGHIVVTGRVKIENKNNGLSTITVYELPYGVSTDIFLEAADAAFKSGKLAGISDLKDASSERMGHPIQVIFYLKRGEDPQVVLNQLYEHTPLKTTYAGNMIALVEGKDGDRIPSKTPLNLRSLMQAWIAFRKEVITKRTTIHLQTFKKEILRLTALLIATNPINIDKVVDIIKNGKNEVEVIAKLMSTLNLIESQVRDILEITLRRLMTVERSALEKQLEQKQKQATDAEKLLKNPELVDEVIIRELEIIEKSYGDDRRTEIQGDLKKIEAFDLIPDESVIVTMTAGGYVKRTSLEAFRKTGRGAKGAIGAVPDEEDTVAKIYSVSNRDILLAFTNKGMAHSIRVYEIPESSKSSKGRALVNLLSLKDDEKVINIVPVSGEFDDREIAMATARGLIKKTKLSEFSQLRSGGIIALRLQSGDSLIGAILTTGKQDIMLATRKGFCLRFKESEVRSQGRNTRGCRGMSLKSDTDEVCVLLCLDPQDERHILTFTQGGVGKRTSSKEYMVKHRSGKGVATTKVSSASESQIATLALVGDNDEVIIITNQGKSVRLSANAIRISDRSTKGVRLMKLEEGQKIVDATVVSP